MSEYKITGSCLCGGVSYEISGNLGIFQYCYCSRCRKVTGSAHASSLFVKKDDFRWLSGQAQIARYEPQETKYFATTFCTRCGSTLPWAEKTGRTVIVPTGTLDQDPEVRPGQNIFCASRASWYVAPSELPSFDAMPPRK